MCKNCLIAEESKTISCNLLESIHFKLVLCFTIIWNSDCGENGGVGGPVFPSPHKDQWLGRYPWQRNITQRPLEST